MRLSDEKEFNTQFSSENTEVIEKSRRGKQEVDNENNVSIVDIKMPFMSMVVFMVKAAIAAIPAMIILAIVGSIITALFGGLFGGMGR